MSVSFRPWFVRFVRWFFNSSPTALLDADGPDRFVPLHGARAATVPRNRQRRLTGIDAH
jgi:hypothetical protein